MVVGFGAALNGCSRWGCNWGFANADGARLFLVGIHDDRWGSSGEEIVVGMSGEEAAMDSACGGQVVNNVCLRRYKHEHWYELG
jgi:hypothetical protein